jgi:hypothetical protein
MGVELVDRVAILWHFVDSMAWVLRTLVHCAMTFMFACVVSFVDLLRFGGMPGENSCNVSLLLLMVPWVRRDALQKGSVDDLACLRAPRA